MKTRESGTPDEEMWRSFFDPSMDIRFRPFDGHRWVEQADFVVERGIIDLPPYHYGLIGRKKERTS